MLFFVVFLIFRCLLNMELAICKTEIPTIKFMTPQTSFYERSINQIDNIVHDMSIPILNFHSSLILKNNYQFANSSSSIITNNNNNISSHNNNNSDSTMRLKKNRKVTFLPNFVQVSYPFSFLYNI